MVDFLIQMTIGNVLVASALALVAWVVQTRIQSASLANLLWALVLIKLITPPLFSIPVLECPSIANFDLQESPIAAERLPTSFALISPSGTTARENVREKDSTQSQSPIPFSDITSNALSVWLCGSIVLMLVSSIRIIRFHVLLNQSSHVDEELSSGLSRNLANSVGVTHHPNIVVTSANIAPFVWWMDGQTVIVISEFAVRQLSKQDLRMVLTHEMAHIKRRDHWFRWLEWISLICFWWNPIMWWARTQLRISEEIACDDLVLTSTKLSAHQYANSLLNMAELMAESVVRPPVVASAINSGGSLEKRLKIMINNRNWNVPAALRTGIVAAAVFVFPIGMIVAQDFEGIERRLGGAVEAGEISLGQANLMLDALRESAESEEMELKERYMRSVEKVKRAIVTGEISEEEAEHKLGALREDLFEHEHKWRIRHRRHQEHGEYKEHHREHSEHEDHSHGDRERHFHEVERMIDHALHEGHISAEEAETKLKQLHEQMRKHELDQHGDHDKREHEHQRLRDIEMHLHEMHRKIERALHEGDISKEEAKLKMSELHERMQQKAAQFDDHEHEDHHEERDRHIHEAEIELERSLREGKISEEEAEVRMMELREKMEQQELELHRYKLEHQDSSHERELREIEVQKVARAAQLANLLSQKRQLQEQFTDREKAIEGLEIQLKERDQIIRELEERHQQLQIEFEKQNFENKRNIELNRKQSEVHQNETNVVEQQYRQALEAAEIAKQRLGTGHPSYELAKKQVEFFRKALSTEPDGVIQEGLNLERQIRK